MYTALFKKSFGDLQIFLASSIIIYLGLYALLYHGLQITKHNNLAQKIKSSIIPDAYVFSSKTNSYSILLGGKVNIITESGNFSKTSQELSSYTENNVLNNSYNKILQNITNSSYIDIIQSNGIKYKSLQYKAAQQLLCTNKEIKKIEIQRYLIQQNKDRTIKEFSSFLDCNEK